jgi:TolA-binding protein
MKRVGSQAVIAFALLSVALFLSACGKQDKPVVEEQTEVSIETVKEETKEALEAAKAYTLQQKQEYQEKAEAKLDEIDITIAQLKGRAEKASDEAKTKLDAQVEELQKKQEAAREKLQELESAGAEKWEDLKSDMDAAIDDLANFIDELLPSFE